MGNKSLGNEPKFEIFEPNKQTNRESSPAHSKRESSPAVRHNAGTKTIIETTTTTHLIN
mgnify:CR=1 FL=1